MERSIFDVQAEFCKAMGNADRLRVMHALREGPRSVSQIAQASGLSRSVVSRQLAILRAVGVTIPRRQGKEIIYELADRQIGEVCDLVRTILQQQVQRSSRIWLDK